MRAASSRALRIRGLIVAAVLAIVATTLCQAARGKYDDTFKLTVVADTIGEGLAPGAEVKFHGLAIGSVKTLESTGYNRQTMTVLLDPRQAKALTADTVARFTSSNVFGTAAVELVSEGKGPRLLPNQTLMLRTDVQAASVTGLLRQGQRLSRILDTPEFDHVIEVLRRHADLVEPAARAGLDLAQILADSQTMPVSRSLSVLASFLNGVDGALPALGLAPELLDALDPLVAPGGVDRTNLVMRQTGQLLRDAGEISVRHSPWLRQLVGAIMNVEVPAMFAVGSLAPAYGRLSGLIDRTAAAFPVVDGDVRMRTEVILDGGR
ncbi:MCE family protein [Mycobacterium shinjukuense]|uniref:Putative Mce family protein n=1 Tax=Mycobacterium shinjukuense TaxID=398694 RepID=A0A7I7MUN7_9MYCO|nr:MlaD family protein [Mycobacterium shinjukuense]MCV6987510.1 MCE family protein [Mycobacterium shinjukuense]ORB69980.1 mammalian cell entry protein [Mycobacterium shinjukuense]BBX75954.1 putative Mce family protein [Mycobacterium shinjukuense]